MTTMHMPGATPVFEQARATRMPLCILICLALFNNLFFTTGHDRQRLLEVAVLIASAIISLARPAGIRSAFSSQGGKPLAAFFLLGILGSLQAFSISHALFEVSILFLLYVFALQIARDIEVGGNVAMLRLLQGVGLICALYSVKFWVAYVTGLVLGASLDVSNFYIGFSNVRFFNHMQTPILPLLILLCCVTPRPSRLRWLWWSLTAYWWMAMFAVSGRGTMMGMVAGCIAVALLRRRQAAPYLKAAAISAALGLLAYAVFLVAIPVLCGGTALGAFAAVLERTAADPASNRFVLWGRALELIQANPWFGVGPMHFAHHAGDLHSGAHPHDWIMQIASEWGIPALLCLVTALALSATTVLRAGHTLAMDDRLNQNICSVLVAGGATILVDGLVSGLFVMPQSQLATVLYLGCAIGWCRGRAQPADKEARPGRMYTVLFATLITGAAVCLALVVWPDAQARYRNDPLPTAVEALNEGINWPRMWQAGFF